MRPPSRSLVLAPPRQVEVIDYSVRPLQLEVGEYTGWEFGQLEVNMRDLIEADQNLIATLNGRVPKQGAGRV